MQTSSDRTRLNKAGRHKGSGLVAVERGCVWGEEGMATVAGQRRLLECSPPRLSSRLLPAVHLLTPRSRST